MSDENASGTAVPPATPATGGAFDWLRESHQSSAPMAPLTDDIPMPSPVPASYALPDPAQQPTPPTSAPMSFPGLLAPSPSPAAPVAPAATPVDPAPTPYLPTEPVAPAPFASQPVVDAPTAAPPGFPAPAPAPAPDAPPTPPTPVQASSFPLFQTDPVAARASSAPAIVPPTVQPSHPQLPPVPAQAAQPQPLQPQPFQPGPTQPATPLPPVTQRQSSQSADSSPFSFGAEPAAPSAFAAGLGPSTLGLERHETQVRSGNTPLDWIAFVLAFLLPPIGLLLGIGAVVSGSSTRGYVASLAKAAIGIGAALTLVLGVAFAVVTKIDNDNAAHASIVASSAAWCTKLKANPTALSSDTLGWPSAGDTIPKSIAAIKSYETNWESLAKIAPTGIRADSQKVADTAKSIESSVESTQTLNDSGNVAEMQNVVATTGIKSWVSTYCN